MRRAAVLLPLLLLAVSASACGDDQDVVAEAEAGVATVLADRLAVPASAIAVTCPEDLELDPGVAFTCGVTLTDDSAAPTSEVGIDLAVAEDGTVQLQRAVIPVEAAEAYLATSMEPTAEGPVTVDCGAERLIVRSVGETFECTATRTADGVQFHTIVDVTAVDGTVNYRVERTTTTTAPPLPTTAPGTLPTP